MNYKVIFSQNNILICKPTDVPLPKNHTGNVHYQYDEERKQLIYAIIKAESFEEANEEAKKLIQRFINSN